MRESLAQSPEVKHEDNASKKELYSKRSLLSHLHTHQDMPNIFIGSLEAAEPNADTEKATAAPRGAGRDGGLPHRKGLAAVQQHLHRPLYIDLQKLFQRVVIPVLLEISSFNSVCDEPADFIQPVNERHPR